jgi:hypothetical protein
MVITFSCYGKLTIREHQRILSVPPAVGQRETGNFSTASLRLAKIRLLAAVFVLVLIVVVFSCGKVVAETEENALWSIDLGAISLSEAFDQLSQVTDIKIFTTTLLTHKIPPKRYMKQSIDQILKDMLRNVNYAAVWHYSEKGITSIGIFAFDPERGKGHSNVSSAKRTGQISRPLPRVPGPKRIHPIGQVGESERYKNVREPPAKLEETEGSEIEESDEESVDFPVEADYTSALSSSDSQVEPPTDSSNEEEGSPSDQQDEGEESRESPSPEKKRGEEE